VICALLRDFSKHGEKAIAKVRRTHPAAYLKICVLLVPRENKVEHSRKVSELSDEQLDGMIEILSTRIPRLHSRYGPAGSLSCPRRGAGTRD
jgi:hypothetical protein